LDRSHHRVFRGIGRVCAFLRSHEIAGKSEVGGIEVGGIMDLQSLVMLIISAVVTVYLFYALLRPEKF
jgi:K+-transporting ATPase KdpF subunit